MKKTLNKRRLFPTLGVLFSLLFVLLLINSVTAIEYMKKGLKLCAETVIPSLFPFMILSSLLVSSGAAKRLCSPIGKPFKAIFGVSEAPASSFILGLLCGFPIGAKTLCDMYDRGEIGESELLRAMTFCNNPGVAFVISTLGGTMLKSRLAGLLLFVCVILSALAVGVTFRSSDTEKQTSKIKYPPLAVKRRMGIEDVTSAISSSALSMLNICACVTFFTSLVGCIGEILRFFCVNEAVMAAIFGIFELTGGVSAAAKLPLPHSLFLCGAALGWSGLSVHLQISSICGSRIKLKKYYAAKILQAAICGVLSALLGVFALR